MNTKVEEALAYLHSDALENRAIGAVATANRQTAALAAIERHIAQQDATIARLREALKFYADPASHASYETYDGNGYTASAVDKDLGDYARAALTQEQGK